MINITNGTLSLSARNGTSGLLYYAISLARFFSRHRSFLNVSSERTSLFNLILLAKSAAVCYGISNVAPLPVSVQLLLTLTCYSLVFVAGSYFFNLTIIWGTFATLFCFNSSVIRLPAFARHLISVATLCVAPNLFRVPCTLECIVDILLIVYSSWFAIEVLWGPAVKKVIERLFVEVTAIMILLSIDLFVGGGGVCFMWIVVVIVFFDLVIDAFLRGDIFAAIVMSFFFCYCLHEQNLMSINNQLAINDQDLVINHFEL